MYFFFSSRRRHTRFDCDWSSDVCSSDLTPLRLLMHFEILWREEEGVHQRLLDGIRRRRGVPAQLPDAFPVVDQLLLGHLLPRSEERRVGKECISRGLGDSV